MKIFISQPMRGKSTKEILAERNRIITFLKTEYGPNIDIVNLFKDFPTDAKPLWLLGKSLEELSTADTACFADGWQDARGCKIEYEAAKSYGIHIIHYL